MDSPFIYNRFVTGRNFVGRKAEVNILSNMLSQHEDVVLYDTPKSGKTSLIQQAFYNMKMSSGRFDVSEISLLNVRTAADLCTKLGSALIKDSCSTPEEYGKAVEQHLCGTHFVFDARVYYDTGMILSLNWDPDENDVSAIFRLPYLLSKSRNQKRYVVLEDFQNIELAEDGDGLCRIIHNVLSGTPREEKAWCSYIFTGSSVNAMKDIFEVRRLFYRDVEHVELGRFDTKEVTDHFMRGFMAGGKVIDKGLAMGACELFKNNIWYINHFGAICNSLSRGYMNESIMEEALGNLIAVHEPEYVATMNGLTTFQTCLLKAILDGHVKFSSSEVIRRYRLSSSANVRRLKDALCKKEIVTFESEDRPVILDPLFEHWVRKHYFQMTEQNG